MSEKEQNTCIPSKIDSCKQKHATGVYLFGERLTMKEHFINLTLKFLWKIISLWKIILISLILFLWNILEIRYHCIVDECDFFKKESSFLGIFHRIYHNIENTSLIQVASFFSLFALVIALIQAIYPYRLGELYGYPIGRLKETFDKQKEIQKLIYCVFVAVIAEIFRFHIVEAGVVLIGYITIGKWIYQIVKWYKNFEDKKSEFLNQFKKDWKRVLEKGNEKTKEEKEVRELIERMAKSGGVEEREILEEMAMELYLSIEKINEQQYQKIFELSFYLTECIIENSLVKKNMENSWHFKMLKENILKSSLYMEKNRRYESELRAEEAFILGLLCGCMAENDMNISKWCVNDILFEVQKQVNKLQAVELISMLCVFLELYSDINEGAVYTIDTLIKGNNFNEEKRNLMQLGKVRNKMFQMYYILLRLNYMDAIIEYDLVDVLHKEISGIQNTIPTTIFGLMLTFVEN